MFSRLDRFRVRGPPGLVLYGKHPGFARMIVMATLHPGSCAMALCGIATSRKSRLS